MTSKLLTLYSRLFIHTLMNGIPQLVFQWSIIILPEILRDHFGVQDNLMISFYASMFYMSYFCGNILSCFVWPVLVNYVSKRRCILSGFVMYGVITMISSTGKSIMFLVVCRFFTGIFLNENSIGKDLLFEFCKGNYRQIGLSLDSAWSLTLGFGGPLIGLMLYRLSGNNLSLSLIYIGSIYLFFGAIFFILFFLVPYKAKRRNSFKHNIKSLEDVETEKMTENKTQPKKKDKNEEENLLLLPDTTKKDRIKTRSTKEVIYNCIHLKTLRNPILIYAFSISITATDLLLTVILLETAWKDQGYGLSPGSLSRLWAMTVVPAVIIILVSPKYCPSRISYSTFVRVFILTFAFGVLFTPLLRDLIPEKHRETFTPLIYLVIFLKNCSCGRLYAPFIHFQINNRSNRYIRTLINTINFIVVTALTILLVNLIVPMLSVMLFSPIFTRFAPFNKYPLFLILAFMQLCLVFLIEDEQKGEVLEPVI